MMKDKIMLVENINNEFQMDRTRRRTEMREIDREVFKLIERNADWFEFVNLKKAGADFNVKDGNGETPLDIATKYKKKVMSLYLRRNGALTSEELTDPEKHTPDIKSRIIESMNAAIEYAMEIKMYRAGEKYLRELDLTEGNYDKKMLFDSLEYELHIGDSDNMTILHYAAMIGAKDFLEFMILLGADINLGDIDGLTPLNYARAEDIWDLLKRNGGVQNIKEIDYEQDYDEDVELLYLHNEEE